MPDDKVAVAVLTNEEASSSCGERTSFAFSCTKSRPATAPFARSVISFSAEQMCPHLLGDVITRCAEHHRAAGSIGHRFYQA